ncbi:hypothetical protein F0562_005617 [Nyssa sinensis]|uniref:Uncharacterized protein n=1 Tax=Nyssa sinensis TaxID=561372 RepID=A0A5J5AIM5_9ASTE|nr:hypothetical protein F0562_005617 [Nyssa sinensis]
MARLKLKPNTSMNHFSQPEMQRTMRTKGLKGRVKEEKMMIEEAADRGGKSRVVLETKEEGKSTDTTADQEEECRTEVGNVRLTELALAMVDALIQSKDDGDSVSTWVTKIWGVASCSVIWE